MEYHEYQTENCAMTVAYLVCLTLQLYFRLVLVKVSLSYRPNETNTTTDDI